MSRSAVRKVMNEKMKYNRVIKPNSTFHIIYISSMYIYIFIYKKGENILRCI